MIKFLYKFILVLFFSFILFVFLSNPNLIMNSVNYSVSVFFSNVLPSLFPFFILADALINYNYVYFLNKVFRFKYSYLILMSLFSGLPSNAKYISNLISKNEITIRDASILLSVTFFPNPMFVIGSVGSLMLGSVKFGVFILASVYLANFLVYLFYYKSILKKDVRLNVNNDTFVNFLRKSIINNSKTLLIILGTIVVFTTLSNVIFSYIDVPDIIEAIFTGIFEMTSGVKKVSSLSITDQSKIILLSFLISFSGISVLCQAFSILGDVKLDIKFILKNKLIVVILTFLISYFCTVFWM